MALRIDRDGAMFRCTMDVDGAHMPHRGNQLTRSARNLILLLPLLSIRAAALPSGALPLRIRVGILVYEGVYDTEFVAPLDAFRHAANYTSGRLEAFTVAPHGGAVRTAEGLRFSTRLQFPNGADHRLAHCAQRQELRHRHEGQETRGMDPRSGAPGADRTIKL